MGTINFLIHCIVYAGLYTVLLLITILKSPRLLLDYYPEEIRSQVLPKTKYEILKAKKYQRVFAVLYVMYPFVITCFNSLKQNWQFWETVFFSWRLMLFVSIYSLIIIDWLVFCTITPPFIVIPGSAGNKAYKNYNIPFFKFLRNLVIITVLSIFNAFVIHIKI